MKRTTEASSNYDGLEKMSTIDLITSINKEDQTVPFAIEKELKSIEKFIDAAFEIMDNGGRLFYLGAGTSGRLGIVDASECPPTYGVPFDLVNGIIAGGDGAIRKAVEFAEDDQEQGWKDLLENGIKKGDVVVGIAASGTTPYVIGAIKKANENGVLTCGLSCNEGSPLSTEANYSITPVVGPEFVTGSTRMKAGTAQKLVLNMISTSLMIKLGKVQGNRMVDMQLSNHKLVDRGTKMVQEKTGVDYEIAKQLLLDNGSVREAVNFYFNNK